MVEFLGESVLLKTSFKKYLKKFIATCPWSLGSELGAATIQPLKCCMPVESDTGTPIL